MAKGEKNRRLLLDAGRSLLLAKGYNAAGVQEIADAAGVPKGSFYNHFPSKETFAKEILQTHAERVAARLDEELLAAQGPPLARLRALLERWSEDLLAGGTPHGCLVGNLCQEVANQADAMRSAIEESFSLVESKFAACLAQAIDAGELPADFDKDTAAAFLYNAWQGAMLRAKAQRDRRPLDVFVAILFDRVLR